MFYQKTSMFSGLGYALDGRAIRRTFMARKIENMLAHSPDGTHPIGKQELPVALAERDQKPELSQYEQRVEGNGIHITDRLVVSVMRNRRAHDELAHVVVVVVVGQQHALADAFLVVGRVIKWCTKRDLQRPR